MIKFNLEEFYKKESLLQAEDMHDNLLNDYIENLSKQRNCVYTFMYLRASILTGMSLRETMEKYTIETNNVSIPKDALLPKNGVQNSQTCSFEFSEKLRMVERKEPFKLTLKEWMVLRDSVLDTLREKLEVK